MSRGKKNSASRPATALVRSDAVDERSAGAPSAAVWPFYLVVFLSAALAFQIQPLMTRLVLPWFGGTPTVWTVCLLFFQSTLFLGYALAFALANRLSPRTQGTIFVALLIVAALTAPLAPSQTWRTDVEDAPAWRLLLVLGVHAGLPYLLLCASSPLVQDWYRRAAPGRTPYRLYALSNAGSILGLVSYPLLVEPWLPLSAQTTLWRTAFVVYLVLTAVCALRLPRGAKDESPASTKVDRATAPDLRTMARWFFLAATPTILLSASTEKLSVDVSPGPFLWIIPLTIYLATLIVCFSRESIPRRRLWGAAVLAALPLVCGVLILEGTQGRIPLSLQFGGYLLFLFVACMECHGELVRTRPAPERLTTFYLVTSAGGAAGGVFTGIVAPLIFSSNFELAVGVLLAYTLTVRIGLNDEEPSHERSPTSRGQTKTAADARWNALLKLLGGAIVAAALATSVHFYYADAFAVTRNFYGVLRIREYDRGEDNHAFELVHGATLHGLQYVHEPYNLAPTTYYSPTSGVGLAITAHATNRPRKIGVVGLGVGTLAAYGQPGDHFDFYEINPTVAEFAKSFFRYLSDSKATTQVILGDARTSLERRPDENYDLLVLDAFGSDAIPMHLLTVEAMEIYLRHLRTDGILAMHVSNRHLDLLPVARGHAERYKLSLAAIVDSPPDGRGSASSTTWVLLARDLATLKQGALPQARMLQPERSVVWTDDYSSLLHVLR